MTREDGALDTVRYMSILVPLIYGFTEFLNEVNYLVLANSVVRHGWPAVAQQSSEVSLNKPFV